jgi:protease-4
LIKAVVLRVDSPGGAALTSDIIWAQLQRIPEHKPLIVSMGNVAASGGYYIALPGQKVVATPLTVTGSIGAFATVPNIKQLSADLGINAQQVGTHPNALGYSPFSALSPGLKSQLRKGLLTTYTTFKARVASGRNMDDDTVEALAQGRVWGGTQALQNGLVDSLGGLTTALEIAAKAAALSSYSTVSYPKWKPDFNQYISTLFSGVQLKMPFSIINTLLPVSTSPLPIIENPKSPSLQLELPYRLNIN